MDKIHLAGWDRIFGKTQQQLVFANDHYSDLRLSFEEESLMSGTIHHIATPGMQLVELSVNSGKSFQLVDEEEKESAESVFVLEGSAHSQFHNLEHSLQLNKCHHNLQYNPQFAGYHTITSPLFHAITVSYELSFLQRLLHADDTACTGQLANSINSKKPWLATSHAFKTQSRVTEIIHSIRNCPFSGTTKYIFLESKMMELLVMQMEQLKASTEKVQGSKLSASDCDKLFAVKEYIEGGFLDLFSLRDLTFQFGLNEFKLKNGYRKLFNTSVFGHVNQLRMQKARMLLLEKEMNVSEAAFFVGYQNVSSFCTEFKKRFGFSPGKLNAN